MGEEGEVVSFLKGFTDRAFAGHLLRRLQANTVWTATEVALEKEAEQKKEHQVMDEEPIEVGGAQTNQESADAFLSILETMRWHMGQLQACMDKQESAQLPAPRRVSTLEQTRERRQYCGPRMQMRQGKWTWTQTKELTGCCEQPTSQSVRAAKG